MGEAAFPIVSTHLTFTEREIGGVITPQRNKQALK